jgi:membrane protein DedA with SNARE-associated domain
MIQDFIQLFGYAGIFVAAFLLNLLPFSSPSNLVISGAIAALFPQTNPLLVGLAVATAASLAKIIHYFAGSLVARFGKPEAKGRLQRYGVKLGSWGAVGAFIVAATPIPDDPVVIPLGMMKYGAVKFFVPYFLGKVTLTTAGAYLARYSAVTITELFGAPEYLVLGAVLSIVVVVVLVRVDVEAAIDKFRTYVRSKRKSSTL